MRKTHTNKLLIVLIILVIISIILKYKYSLNNNYIKKYNNQEYDINIAKKLLVLNFQEKYIAHYNYGTALYQNEQYENAKEEFSEALKTVPNNRICDVRVNLALTEIKLLPETKEKDVYKKNIENIQNILLENDCATKDHNGKDKKSQDLYDLLEQAKNNNQNNQDDNNNQSDDDSNNQEEQKIKNEEDKINKIKEKNKEGSKERSPANDRDDLNFDYKKKVW